MKRKIIIQSISILLITPLLYVGGGKLLDHYSYTKQMATILRKPEKTGLEGKSLPSFKLLLSDSITYFSTDSIPEGKPVVLFYFGPECPYCHIQMEEIIKDINRLKGIQFYIFTPYPFSKMKEFYKQFQLNKYPNIITGVDYTKFFGAYFETTKVPFIAIYGKDKRLNEVFIGNINSSQITEPKEE